MMIPFPPFSSESSRRSRLFRHGLGWLLFLVYEQCLIWYTNGSPIPRTETLYFYGCNMLAFYLFYAALSRALEPPLPNYAQLVLLTMGTLLVISLLKAAGNAWLVLPKVEEARRGLVFKKYLVMDLFRTIYFMGLSLLVWQAGHIRGYRLRAAEAEKQQLIAERDQALSQREYADARNALLQQQLNPHLLFNSLNFVYSRVLRHSREGAETLLLLAELMRYSMAETDPDGRVALSAEVTQIQNLMTINRQRFDFPMHLDYRFEGDSGDHRIIPLILLTLAENVFKHALLDDPARPALFLLTLSSGGALQLRSFNHKIAGQGRGGPGSIGLRNVRLRLDHSYPCRHVLDIHETETSFELSLSLNL